MFLPRINNAIIIIIIIIITIIIIIIFIIRPHATEQSKGGLLISEKGRKGTCNFIDIVNNRRLRGEIVCQYLFPTFLNFDRVDFEDYVLLIEKLSS